MRNISQALVLWAICSGTLFGQHATADAETAQRGTKARVLVEVVVEATHSMREFLRRSIARELPRRLKSSLGAPAHAEIELEVVRSFPLLEDSPGVGIQAASSAAEAVAGYEKVLHLSIRQSPWSFEISAHDYDVPTRYLCPPARRKVRQPSRVVEGGLETLLAAYSPAAEFQQLTDDPDHVLVRERLSLTTSRTASASRLREGDILVPVLRRGEPRGESALPYTEVIPWTYLVVEHVPVADEGEDAQPTDAPEEERRVLCRVESHSRRALGVRRRGRIEQLAVTVRPQAAPLTLKLLTQSKPHRPLAGCEIFLRESKPNDVFEADAVGVSDLAGEATLAATRNPIQVLWIKSGELLLAKVPVVWGLADTIDIPLPEDPARIRAAADLRALRTDLVDLVARRNILLARARAAVADRDVALAGSLADELDKLPTRAQFNQRINMVAQVAKSPDRLAQARIDMLVEETRSVLGQFLDPRELSSLRSAINNAAK